jgi:hypothetical protein
MRRLFYTCLPLPLSILVSHNFRSTRAPLHSTITELSGILALRGAARTSVQNPGFALIVLGCYA